VPPADTATVFVTSCENDAVYVWTNMLTGEQQWDAPGNWSPNGVPNTPGAVVVFTNLGQARAVYPINVPSSVTVGVVRLMQLTNSYDFRFGTIVFRNGQGGARIEGVRTLSGGYTRSLNTPQTIYEVPHLLVEDYSGFMVWAEGGLAGSGTIVVTNSTGIEIGGTSHLFDGRIVVCNGALVGIRSGPEFLVNANAQVIIRNGGLFRVNSRADTHASYLLDGGGQLLVASGGQLSQHYGDICVSGGAPRIATTQNDNSRGLMHGTLYGEGTLQCDARKPMNSNVFVGAIAPGFSVGTLAFDELSEFGLVLGTPDDHVVLEIDINAVSNDVVTCTSMDQALDLTTIEAQFSVQSFTPEGVTNWFLSSDGGVAGTFAAVSTTMGNAYPVYDYANNRVGVVVTPEPTAALAAAFALFSAARRSSR
jgi:hypothetical protein